MTAGTKARRQNRLVGGQVFWSLGAALVVGCLLRVGWAVLVPVIPVSDSVMYDAFAKSIANGSGYAYPDGTLTAYWPVGTSALYGQVYRLFGQTFIPIVVLNVALGVGVIWLTWAVAMRYLEARTALLAAWFVACWPLLIQFTTVLASELVFVVLVLATLYIWSLTSLSLVVRSVTWATLLCAATYVRPTALPLFAMLPALQAWQERQWRGPAMSFVVACLAATILFAPWVARNYELMGRFVLVSSNFGANLWMGNNPESTGAYMALPEAKLANEVDEEKYFRELAVDYIKQNPRNYLVLSFRRLTMTFDRETIGVVWNEEGLRMVVGPDAILALKAVSSAYWLALAVMSLVGAALAIGSRHLAAIHPLTVVPMLFIAVPILTVGQDRYHVPIDPFVAMFASMLVCCRLKQWRPTTDGKRSPGDPA